MGMHNYLYGGMRKEARRGAFSSPSEQYLDAPYVGAGATYTDDTDAALASGGRGKYSATREKYLQREQERAIARRLQFENKLAGMGINLPHSSRMTTPGFQSYLLNESNKQIAQMQQEMPQRERAIARRLQFENKLAGMGVSLPYSPYRVTAHGSQAYLLNESNKQIAQLQQQAEFQRELDKQEADALGIEDQLADQEQKSQEQLQQARAAGQKDLALAQAKYNRDLKHQQDYTKYLAYGIGGGAVLGGGLGAYLAKRNRVLGAILGGGLGAVGGGVAGHLAHGYTAKA